MNPAVAPREMGRASVEPDDLVVESTLLGSISVPPQQTFVLDEGLLGFPAAHHFALVPTSRDGLFWLQSTEFEALTFLVVDPFEFVDEYSVDLGTKELGPISTEDASELVVLCILTLPRSAGDLPSVNLQGPLAFNLARRAGRQVILQDSSYGTRHTVDLDKRPAA